MSPLSKKILKLKAELSTQNARCAGFIENISKKDIYFLTSKEVPEIDCSPGSPMQFEFASHDGEKLVLDCKMKWAYKMPPLGLTNIIAEVTQTPPDYEAFLKSI